MTDPRLPRDDRHAPEGSVPADPTTGSTPATPAGHEPPPPGVRTMNIVRWALLVVLVLVAGLSIGSYALSRRAKPVAATQAKALYHCPMHPNYTSDKPGECPICGMTLELVPAGFSADTGKAQDTGNVPGLTSVELTPERIQLIGVRTTQVARRPLRSDLDLVGFVAPDEARLKRVQIRVAGWVQKLYVNRTGESVREGQPLLSIYSPELYQSEQEFLIELGATDTTGNAPAPGVSSLKAARQRMRLLAVPDEEIRRLERERTPSTHLELRSPVSGTVLERGVTEGQYVGADTPLFTVADLSRVWVLVDLYEMDYSQVRVGQAVRFVADAMPNRTYPARVEFVYPTVESRTRTLKARLSLDNRDERLRPGMYGRVRASDSGPRRLSIPIESVINTGEHDYVFLARAGGRFEPRMVHLGLQNADYAEVLGGLAEGDTVVASGSFLIDSESRLKAAIAGMGSQSGMAGMPGMDHEHGGEQ